MKNKAPITNCENTRTVSVKFPADYCKFCHFFKMLNSRLSLNNDIVSIMPAISNKREYFVATTLYTITPERKIKNKKVSFYVKCFSLIHKKKEEIRFKCILYFGNTDELHFKRENQYNLIAELNII